MQVAQRIRNIIIDENTRTWRWHDFLQRAALQWPSGTLAVSPGLHGRAPPPSKGEGLCVTTPDFSPFPASKVQLPALGDDESDLSRNSRVPARSAPSKRGGCSSRGECRISQLEDWPSCGILVCLKEAKGPAAFISRANHQVVNYMAKLLTRLPHSSSGIPRSSGQLQEWEGVSQAAHPL
ncbi:hypothetical protein BKA56DRAFT_615115 [Ilyonectria sp. MPI-CAGE-AT-0026]|nr:hypothetical protein BKA56DRAFT_615115 [Ilyonectria sp. MPI-CAGE-AT-0026]